MSFTKGIDVIKARHLLNVAILFVFLLSSFSIDSSSITLAAGPSEETSKFLSEDTTAYISLDLNSSQYDEFEDFIDVFLEEVMVWAAREFVLHDIIEDRWGIDYEDDVKPWLDNEIAAATLHSGDSKGVIFFIGTSDEDVTEDVLDLWLDGLDVVTENYRGVTITKAARTLEGENKYEYYAITGGYLLAAIGEVDLGDFKDVIDGILGGEVEDSLWDNDDFQDVRATLPGHFGLSYLNEENLPESATAVRDALDPYWPYVASVYNMLAEDVEDYLEIEIPEFDDLYDALAPLATFAYDSLRQYIPPYIGISLSAPSDDRIELDFYSPKGDWPFAPDQQNSLETDGFVPYDALWFTTDVNLDAWWHKAYPLLQPKLGEIERELDDLETLGWLDEMEEILGFDPRLLVDFVGHGDIDENTFDWTEGEFAWARLPDEDGEGQFVIFEVTDDTDLNDKIAVIKDALDDVGFSGVESERENGFLVLGYPAGVLDDALARSPLRNQSRYQTLSSYLPGDKRGLAYFDADRLEPYIIPGHGLVTLVVQSFVEPLSNGGLSYFVNDDSLTAKLVLRVYPPPRPPEEKEEEEEKRKKEAEFVFSALRISPTEVYPSEEVHISARVKNVGDVKGSCTATLKINRIVEEREKITLARGESERVRFEVIKSEPGTYRVELSGLKGSFIVIAGIEGITVFALSDLRISPDEVLPNEAVNISAKVANIGEVEGSYSIALKINGVVEQSRRVTLAAGASERVSFVVAKSEPGIYQVELDGLSGSFAVKEGVVPPSWPPAPSWISRYWWAIVIGILAVVLGLLLYILRRRRGTAS